MADAGQEHEVVARARMGRRDFVKRLVAGAVFAVPAIQSFDLAGVSADPVICDRPRDTGQIRFLDTSPNPSTFGQPVTITASVSFSSRGLAPSGSLVDTVEFFDGNTSLGVVPWDRNPVSIVVSTLTVGEHTITATYSGDCAVQTNGSTSGPETHVVNASVYPLAVGEPAMPADGPAAEAASPPVPPAGGNGTRTAPAAAAIGVTGAAAAVVAYRRAHAAPEDG